MRKRLQRIIAMLAVFAVLFPDLSLFSLAENNGGEENRSRPVCGLEEHVHTADCYEKVLICGQEESPAETQRVFRSTFRTHTHGSSCRDEAGNLVCGMIEGRYYHTHNEFCRDADGNLVCGLVTSRPHEHTEECWQTERNLICGQEEREGHTHTDACRVTHRDLTCGLEEREGHIHTDACRMEHRDLTCGLEEREGHIHTDACYTEHRDLTCGLEEREGHTHTDECRSPEGDLICGREEQEGHTHSDACYTQWTELTCPLEEQEGHTHTDACYTQWTELICGLEEQEGHTHTDECYTLWTEIVCGLEEDEGHTHTDECYETVQTLICDIPTTTHHHTEACYDEKGYVTCGKKEIPTFTSSEANWIEEVVSEGHQHTDACYETRLTCGLEEHTHTESCYPAPESQEEPTEEEPTEEEPAEEKPTEEKPTEEKPTEEKPTEEEPTEEEPTEEEPTEEEPTEEEPTEKEPTEEEPTEEEPTEEEPTEEEPTEEEHTEEEPTEEEPTEEEPTEEEPTEEESTEEEPTGEEPTEEEPTEEEPTEEEPTEEEPTEEEPTEEEPTEEEPTEEEPTEEEPPEEEPTEEKPTEEEPTEEEPTEEEPTEEEPTEEEPTEEEPTEEEPTEEGSTEEEPTEEEPTEEEPTEEEPTEEEPTEEEPTEENPTEKEPPEEEPTEEEPTEEEPTEEEPTEEEPSEKEPMEEEPTEEEPTEEEPTEEEPTEEEPTEEEPTEEEPTEVTITSSADAPVSTVVMFSSDAGIPEGTELVVREADETKRSAEPQIRRNAAKSAPVLRKSADPEEEPRADIPSLQTWNAEEEDPEIILLQKTYDFSLVIDGQEIEPDPEAKITVTVALPGVMDGQDVEVLHLTDKGPEELPAVNEGGNVTFVTGSFSQFRFTVRARKLSSWTTERTENTFYGKTASQSAETENIPVSGVTEGLDVLEAYAVTRDSDLWMTMRYTGAQPSGKRESMALYTVEDGNLGALVRGNLTAAEALRFSLGDLSSFALVRDSGLRHRTRELDGVALEGMMPKNAEAFAEDVSGEYTSFIPDGETIAAYDISIQDDGGEYQPEDGPVTVTMRNEQIAEALTNGRIVNVWHIPDEGEPQEITDFRTESGAVVFDAEGFSVYIVTADTFLRTYRFYTLDEYQDYVEYVLYNDQGSNVVTQTIKNGEKPVAPQNPVNQQDSSLAFAGWYEGWMEGTALVLAQDPYDFDHIPLITETEDVRLYAKFISAAYVVFHGQYDAETESFPVIYTRRADVSGGSAEVPISDLKASFEPGENQASNSMMFFGWSQTSVQVPGAKLNDGGSLVQTIQADTVAITQGQTIHLYPVYKNVFWLSFDSGEAGTGATYYPETCYYDGQGPDSLADHIPTRDGNWEFTGWYTGADGTGTKIADENGNLVANASADGISVTDGRIELTANVKLYAGWEASAAANYTIVIVKQRATDEAGLNDADKTYEYSESFLLRGTIGETISIAGTDYTSLNSDTSYNTLHSGASVSGSTNPYFGYEYNQNRSDTETNVEADGSAVIYVRYDWTEKPSTSGSYTLTFMNYTGAGDMQSTELPLTETVPYGAPLKDYIPDDSTAAGRTGYSFGGWYTNSECVTRAFFEDNEAYRNYTGSKVLFETMPGANLTVYAQEWYVVTIDPNYGAMYEYSGGTLTGTGSTWFWSAYGGQIEEYSTVTRRYVEAVSGTWYYVHHAGNGNGDSVWPDRSTYYTRDPGEATEFTTFKEDPEVYRYSGWYEVRDDGTEVLYDFSRIVEYPITLKLHWTKTGVFYLNYDPGIGSLNKNEENEKLYVELDGDAYNDDADVVITRAAVAPAGWEFTGWTIRGDESGRVYRPGDTFRLLSVHAATEQGKRQVYLDAVYTSVATASIIYHPNGGTVNAEAVDFGSQPGNSKVETNYDPETQTATISRLINNSEVILSNGGEWLSMPGRTDVTFAGWCSNPVYDPNDPDAPLLDPNQDSEDENRVRFNVDTEEPADLYAVWATTVYFHLNQDTGAGFGDWGTEYTLNDTGDTYTRTVYLGNTAEIPAVTPTHSDPDIMFREWRTEPFGNNEAPDDTTVYDFATEVTGELHLYAYWSGTLSVPVKALDGSAETIEEKPDWVNTPGTITLDGETIDLTTAGTYVTAPASYRFAFAAVRPADNAVSVSESDVITGLRYNAAAREAYVTYKDGTEAALGSRAVCFVYYAGPPADIRYMSMAQDGRLTAENVSGDAPAATANLGQFNMAEQVTQPLAWAGINDGYYSYAIGSPNAGNASDLILITEDSHTDTTRPELFLENTWRGYRYSTDGGTSWISCGYDELSLYVVYYDRLSTVVIFSEETQGWAEDLNQGFLYDYTIENVNPTTGEWIETVYDQNSEGYAPITLRSGESYSAILFTDATVTQRITVTQRANTELDEQFDTAVTPAGNDPKTYVYTADGTGAKQEAVFTNTRKPAELEVHVVRVDVSTGNLILADDWRTEGSYTFTIRPGEEKSFDDDGTVVASDLVTDHPDYAFGAVFFGTDAEDNVTAACDLAAEKIAFEPADEAGSAYDIYLKNSAGERLGSGSLGNSKIYYLYYPALTVYYVQEALDGSLTPVTGSTDGTNVTDNITYGRDTLTMNGRTVVQGQKVGMPREGLAVSQTVGSGNFNMPPLLDNGVHEHELIYFKLAAISQESPDIIQTGADAFGTSLSEDCVLYMKITDQKLQWSFDGSTWSEVTAWPVVYAIYRERGYELDITKTVSVDTGYREPFTVMISSPAINREKYSVEGTGHTEIIATLEEGQPGVITFPVTDGSIVKLFGMGPGVYTITETGNENYILTATTDRAEPPNNALDVAGNSTITLTLDQPTKVKLLNSPKPICKIGYQYFYTLTSAVQYIEDYSADFTESIEMLINYRMPSSDAPVIPAHCNITITTAADGDEFKECGDTAVITRSDTFTDGAMISNSGRLTLGNVTLDGGLVSTASPMIDNKGTLTLAPGSTLQRAKCSAEGGAVYSWEGEVNVTGGTVAGCEARLGSAIYAEGSTEVNITDGTLSGNSAEKGGVVYYAGSGSVTVSGGTLENNHANDGGAVYMASGAAYVTGGKLRNNTADNGGAVYAHNAYVTVSGGEITENTVLQNGGAILMETLTLTVSGGTVTGNTAGGSGGAFWGGIGAVEISDGVISENTAGGDGGAVYTNESAITISGGSITGNRAQGNGGALSSNAGPVTVSGNVITGNTAETGNGGGVHSNSGTVVISGNLKNNTAENGNGGALWIGSGTVDLNGCTMTGNQAKNGSAMFIATGTANISSGSIRGNTSLEGGAVGVGGTDTRLFFSGAVSVTENLRDGQECNVYLDQDADTIINATTLDTSAEIGVYVPGGDENLPQFDEVFENRGVPSARFGSFVYQDVSAMFKNDRTDNMRVKADTASKKLIWIRDFNIKIYYIASYESGLPYSNGTGNPPGTLVRSSQGTPPSNDNAISEIAEDVRGRGYLDSQSATAVFGNAYREGSVSAYSDYITDVNWNETNNRWDFIQADGTAVSGGSSVDDRSTLILIYTEPYYISIENNTQSPLKISDLTVRVNGTDQSVISRTGTAGYGYVFAKNGAVQDTLYPVTDSDPEDGFDGLVIDAGESIQILVPGGRNMPITLTGSFESADEDVPYTQTGLQAGTITAQSAAEGFTLDRGSMPGSKGGTSEIIFGGDKDVCRVVVREEIPGVSSDTYVRKAQGTGETAGKFEYAFRTPKRALTFILANPTYFTEDGKLTALIEMTADYMITGDDQIKLPTDTSRQYDITLSTSVTGTFQYPGDGDSRRATISRATNNTLSFIKADSGDNASTLTVSNLVFDGKNFSGSINGGIVMTKDWNVEIHHAEFQNCIADNGGGIYIDYTSSLTDVGALTVTDSVFNTCESKHKESRMGGGAIWTTAQVLTVDNCRFSNCTSVDQGGAIFHRIDTAKNRNDKYAAKSVTRVSNSTFTNCQTRCGGGIESDAHDIAFTNCHFTDCYAIKTVKTGGGSGGGLSTYISEDSNGNTSFGETYPTKLVITDCSFTRCTAAKGSSPISGFGGAVRSHSLSTAVTGCTFIDCVAENNGGAVSINNMKGSTEAYRATISNCTIQDCSATAINGGGGQGGAIFSNSQILTIDGGTTIRNCNSVNDGGAVCYIPRVGAESARLNVSDTVMDSCWVTTGTNGGGGLYTTAGTVTLTGCEIKNCTVPTENRHGGGVYVKMSSAGTVTLNGTSIQDCTAQYGAGIRVTGAGTVNILNGSSIARNIAASLGGGVYTNAAHVQVTRSEITGNQATGAGGGICQDFASVSADADLTLDGSTVSGNISGGKGGGIYTEGSMILRGVSSVTGNRLTTDTEANAAGVYMPNNVNLTLGAAAGGPDDHKLTIRDNMTVGGTPSDLRLPEASNVNDNRVRVLCGISGEILVVNAKKRGTQFGTAIGCESPAGFSDLSHVFTSENLDDPMFGIVKRTDETNTQIIWGSDPICKITDGNGRLLYLDAAHTRPAVFDQLDNETGVSAFSTLRGVTDTPLYYANGTAYTGSTYQVKMLVEEYEAGKVIYAGKDTTGAGPGTEQTIILTTAGSNDSLYPYRGRPGTRCTIKRTNNANNAMIYARVNLTIQNIVLDGNSANVRAQADTRMISADYGAAMAIEIKLGRNGTIQNAKSTGNGGGVSLNWGATLTIEGGAIRNCQAKYGGGVYIDGGKGTMKMTAGTITKCTATEDGGGIFYNKAKDADVPYRMTISGGTISRCEAKRGGGIYLNNSSGTMAMEISGGTITGNYSTGKGGGIAVAGTNPVIYLSNAPYIYGNISKASVAEDKACNIEMDQTFTPLTNNTPDTVIVSKGLIRGATIGVYVPEKDNGTGATSSLYDKHGGENDPFGKFEGSDANLNYFINDRNGMKGGKKEGQSSNDKKIYWRIIYALSVSKQVLSDEAADLNKEFSFTVRLSGTSTGSSAGMSQIGLHGEEITGEYGDLYFENGVANFRLKNGETATADLLPLGFTYKVTENLSGSDAGRFKTSYLNDDGTEHTEYAQGQMSNPSQYTYRVAVSNLSAVCKITHPDYGLMYTFNASTYEYEPEVYSNLAKAFNRVNAGDSREWYVFDGENYTLVMPDEYRIEMLIPEYDMDYPESLASLSGGKKATLTTADRRADDGYPYTGSGTAKIVRAVTGESMFTVSGDLTLDNIILDGGSGKGYICNDNGGIVLVKNGGKLTAGTGVTMQNSTSAKNGAAVYLAEGGRMNISGGPAFNNNTVDASAIRSETNGGEDAYATGAACQDIYIAGYTDQNAQSLVVTGNLTGDGTIWVWTEQKLHYWQRQQFAVMQGGTYTGLGRFRNARTDTDTINNTVPLQPLHGESRDGDSVNVYWSGSPIVTVTKQLVYPESTGELVFSFEATLFEADGATAVPDCRVSEKLTTDENGKITFTLKAKDSASKLDSIDLLIPKGYQLKMDEISLPPPEIYRTTINDGTEQSTSIQAPVTADQTIAFVNTRIESTDVVLAVSKNVEGAVTEEEKSHAFAFTVSGVPANGRYPYSRFVRDDDESAWEEVSLPPGDEGRIPSDADGSITFTLSDNQRIVILIPKNSTVTVSEECGDFAPSYTYTLDSTNTVRPGSSVTISEIDQDVDIDFVNTAITKPVAPTGYSSRHTPLILLMIFAFLLLTIGGIGVFRKNARAPREEAGHAAREAYMPGKHAARPQSRESSGLSPFIRGYTPGTAGTPQSMGTVSGAGETPRYRRNASDGCRTPQCPQALLWSKTDVRCRNEVVRTDETDRKPG